MTDEQLAKIKEAAAKATPGPWTYFDARKMHPVGTSHDYGRIIWAENNCEVAQTPGLNDGNSDQSNAEFISLARTAVPALIARLEAAEARAMIKTALEGK